MRMSITTTMRQSPKPVMASSDTSSFTIWRGLRESPGYQTPYEIYIKERVTRNPMQASTIHLIKTYIFVLTMGSTSIRYKLWRSASLNRACIVVSAPYDFR